MATLAACVLLASLAHAQSPPGRDTSPESVAAYGLSQQMPVDPEVLVGGLENGLRFYVRPNPRPARQAELRLVVKAGSVLEDPDQLGLAHFVEHMQFEGTKNFPGQGIIEFLGSLGLSIGADANAATSFDETSYTLRVPTDVPGALERSLQVLSDWAGGATFDPAAIERQRGIVLSEWRMRLGAAERTQDKVRRVQLQGSRYADRSPIGSPEVIEKATREQILRFYRDWYRPNLMAVIVVGDVDRNAVATLVRRYFGGLANPVPERPRPVFDVPEHADTRYAVITDKEATATAVVVNNLRPARSQGTVGGYRDIMRDQLFAAMLDARLDELTQSETPPFLNAAAGRALFSAPKTRDEAALQAVVANDGVARGLDALLTELQRVIRFGFTASELERVKRADLAGFERVVIESPDRESSSRADEYTRNFMQAEALPTIWQEFAFHKRFIPEITLEEVNALARDWFPEQNRLVVVIAPEASTVPDQAQLAAVIRTAADKRLDPYVDAAAAVALMDTRPTPGRIVNSVARGPGITEWTLSNGATVVLQPTTLRTDQILFRAVAPGGTSLASDAGFIQARVADDVIAAGGVGKFTSVMLDKMLTGRAVAVSPFIGEITQGLGGGSAPKDLETMFQLIYLRFTGPRADPTAFGAMRAQAQALLPNQTASPEFAFNQTLSEVLSGGHPRRQPETPATVAQWDLDGAFRFYKARFADARNFTFVFVGSFTPEDLKPLVETYIASLPAATGPRETWRDVGITPPRGVIERTVRKGIAPRAEVSIVFTGAFPYDDGSKLALRTMTMLLQSRLSEAIREQLGGTYAIAVDADTAKFPRPEYRIRINWTCDPARVDSLVSRVFEEIAALKATLLTPDRVARVRDILAKELEDDSRENRWVLNQLVRRYEDREVDLVGANPLREIAALNGYAIQMAAQAYLDTQNYVKVVLLPESAR